MLEMIDFVEFANTQFIEHDMENMVTVLALLISIGVWQCSYLKYNNSFKTLISTLYTI